MTRLTLVAAGLALTCTGPAAHAQRCIASVDLPEMPLDLALRRFAELTKAQILFDPALVAGMRSHEVSGCLAPAEVLKRMLSGLPLESVLRGKGTFVIRRRMTEAKARPLSAVPRPLSSAPFEPVPLADIVVTTARFVQNLRDVAASVSVIGGDELRSRPAGDAEQILSGVPGLGVRAQPTGYSIAIRGLGADMPTGTTQGSVALKFDDIYSPLPLDTTLGYFDVARVEIVRGPQSTRHGPNAEGGVVDVVSTDPGIDARDGYALLMVGNYGLVRVEGAQDVPLGPNAALRVAGAAALRNSYIDDHRTVQDNRSIRVKLKIAPGSGVQAMLWYRGDHIGGSGMGSEAGGAALVDRVAPYRGGSINRKDNPWANDNDAQTVSGRDRSELYQHQIAGRISANVLGPVVLDASASYATVAGSQTSCVNQGAPWAVDVAVECYGVHDYAPYHAITGELRLSSVSDDGLRWNLGLYGLDYFQRRWADENQSVAGSEGGTAYGTRTIALYGEATVPVVPGLRVVQGLRYSRDQRLLAPPSLGRTYRHHSQRIDYRLGEEYDIAPGVLQYATLSTGYRPGGLNYVGNDRVLTFADETTTAFEAGLRAQLLGGRLLIDIDGFHYRQHGYQFINHYVGYAITLADGSAYTCTYGLDQPDACAIPVFNVSRAYNTGLEWQGKLSVTRDDVFSLDGTWMNARFGKKLSGCANIGAPTQSGCWVGYNSEATGALEFFDLSGRVQPHSPRLSLTARFEHGFDLAAGRLTLSAEAVHSSGYWVHPIEDAEGYGYQPGYWLANLGLRFVNRARTLTISAYVRNLSNYAVKLSALPATTIGEPRLVGFSTELAW